MSAAKDFQKELSGLEIIFSAEQVSSEHWHCPYGDIDLNIYSHTTPYTTLVRVTCINVPHGLMKGAKIHVTGTRTNGTVETAEFVLDRDQSVDVFGFKRDRSLTFKFV